MKNVKRETSDVRRETLDVRRSGLSSLFFFAVLVSLLTFLVSPLALASSGGAEGGEPHKSLLMEYFWQLVNFGILVSLLVYMAKMMDIKGYFRKRTELIEQTLKEAKEARALAEKALAEVEEKLRLKDKDVQEIMAYARQSAEKEKQRLIEEGESMKAKILEQTRNNIDYELKQAKTAIKEEAVLLAMELAEKKIKDTMTKDAQVKLLEESLAKIEGKN